MNPELIQALEISAVGMGLVFGGMLILWGFMVLLVKVTYDPDEAGGEEAE